MIIDIDNDLFKRIKDHMQKRHKTMFKELENIEPLENIANHKESMQNARTKKTEIKKENIKNAILEIKKEGLNITKYQVHKKTGIAYITIAKYYDKILKDTTKSKS